MSLFITDRMSLRVQPPPWQPCLECREHPGPPLPVRRTDSAEGPKQPPGDDRHGTSASLINDRNESEHESGHQERKRYPESSESTFNTRHSVPGA